MATNQTSARSWCIELPIYALSFNSMMHFVLSVSMAGLAQSFPDVSVNVLMYLLSITTLTAIPGGFLVPFLVSRFSKKDIVVVGLAGGCLCALLYLLFPSHLPLLFIAAAGQGIVCGIISTAFPLMVITHVEESHRKRVMGIGVGMIQFGRLSAFFLAGFLAVIRWNLIYLVYTFMLVALILIIFLLPQDRPNSVANASATVGRSGGSARKLLDNLLHNAAVWQFLIITLLYGLTQFLTSSHLSLYIEGYHLGLSTTTGTLSAASYALAGVVGCFFAPIHRLLGKYTVFAVFLIIGVGYAVAGFFISLLGILIALMFCSVAQAVYLPYALMCVDKVSDADTAPTMAAMIPACLNLGSFLSSSLTGFMATTLGLGAPAESYLYIGILSLGLGTIVLLVQKKIAFLR